MIGRLRRRVVIEERGRAADAAGGAAVTWTPLASVWAWVKPAQGGENVHAEQTRPSATYAITIRYRDDITRAHRLVLDGNALAITAIIDPNDHRHWLVLSCEEGRDAP